ncbi:hypothetical protein M885DRAFT_615907 [Pelagophyceae sp. CCMP2097]|nr:hypothetical protein M885DRAFT_615907 [Pelagophyceae sp. CCMP2097]
MLRIACLLLVSLRCALAETLEKATTEVDKVKKFIEADLNKVWVPTATVAAGFNTGAYFGARAWGDPAVSMEDYNDHRKQIFNLLTAIGNDTSVDAIYYATEDGTFVIYFDFVPYSLVDGWNCAWNYSGAPCFGVPCAEGMAAQPPCRKYYDVDIATGDPGKCVDEVEVDNITDACYYDNALTNASYDPRARPWYNTSKAASEAGIPATWSSPYVFSTERVVGLTATVAFGYGPGAPFAGVAALDIQLTDIDAVIAAASEEAGVIYYIVENDGTLIATSMAGVALVEDAETGDIVQVAAADAPPIIAESYAAFLAGGSDNATFSFNGTDYWLINSTIIDAVNLEWDLLALHPVE